MPQPEAFSRILIDKALEFSGWDLLKPQQIQFELHAGNGRADYLLKDSLGRVLCVLEAKREGLDPYDAKEQARGYAEKLNAPFIILSNGREHWFWNYERADQRDAYRIERLPSREDLERVRLKNLQPPRSLSSEIVTPEYLRHLKHDLTLRRYQIERWTRSLDISIPKACGSSSLKWRPAQERHCSVLRSSAAFS
jgi:type I site-specific restriction endonuclease